MTQAQDHHAAKFEMTRNAAADASDTALYFGPGLDSPQMFDALPTVDLSLRSSPMIAQTPRPAPGLFWVGLTTGLIVGGLQLALRFLC